MAVSLLEAGAGDRRAWRRHLPDVLLAAVLGLAAAVVSHRFAAGFPTLAFGFESDTWFEGDLWRVFLAMTKPVGHDAVHRSNVHPLFILVAHSPIAVLQRVGIGDLQAVRAVVAGTAGLWLAGLFVALRLVGLRRLDAVVFALMGASSAAAAFWLTVPETYPLASLSMVVALGLVALAQSRPVPVWASVAASAGSLSFVTTNWMAGLAAAVVQRPWRRAVTITVLALGLVLVLWGVQKALYRDVEFFIGNTEKGSQQFFSHRAGGPIHVAQVAWLFSESMPNYLVKPKGYLTVQLIPLSSYEVLGGIAAVAWIVLLVLGLWGLVKASVGRPFRIALALTLVGQTALVMAYGTETFLYALNFTVLLVLLASLAARTRARPLALAVALVVTAAGAVNNYELRQAAAHDARQSLQSQYREQGRAGQLPP